MTVVELPIAEAHAIAEFMRGVARERAVRRQPVTHVMRVLLRRLDTAIAVSSRRHAEGVGLAGLGASRIGTRQASAILGRGERWVQRHATDLDAVKVGDRLVFDERAVHEYAKATALQRSSKK